MEIDYGDLLLERYKKIRENHNQISTCKEWNNNPSFIEIDDSCSQQVQIENFHVNNYKFDYVEQMNEIYDDHTNLLIKTLENFHEKQNQISMCDESIDNPSFTQIDDFQITTFEFDNDDLNQVVKNTIIKLDFNSFEGVKFDLNFDLPFSENLNTTTLNFKLDLRDEVFDNPIKEDEFNEHEFFGLLDDELLNSNEEDENHHFDFEINNSENVFNDKLEFQIGENKLELQSILLSTTRKYVINNAIR